MPSSNPPRPQPRYYLPTAASPSLPSRSRRQSTTTGNVSLPSSPIRRSPGSLAALRSALQSYHVPDPAEPRTPQRDPRYGASKSSLNLQPEHEGAGSALRPEMMDALVAIHRVLYRGRQDLEYEGRSLGWVEKGKEVRRVVERWFEGDCVYDHPLVRVSSRQSLLAHLILLHLMSSLYLPSLTPAALIQHARGLTSHLRNWLIGVDDEEPGKEKEAEEEWLGVETGKHEREEDDVNDGSWWRVWDVGADCKEIGAMECYDGCHLAMIEHVISLTLLPSLAQTRIENSLIFSSTSSTSPSTSSLPSLDAATHSFPWLLLSSLLLEFDSLLHWDLPISTMIEFNEVGKATYVRDMVDVRDVVETFIPFARRIGWVTRRITGLVLSTIGGLAMAIVPGPKVEVTAPIRVEAAVKGKLREAGANEEKRPRLGSAIGLGFDSVTTSMPMLDPQSMATRPRVGSDESEANSLGLEGLEAGMAPDVDDQVVDA